MMKTVRITETVSISYVALAYSAIMLLAALLVYATMNFCTYRMDYALGVVARAVYHIGIVVAIGLAGLPWLLSAVNTKHA
jgi:hypothetical protein